jgi:hypothetical protein
LPDATELNRAIDLAYVGAVVLAGVLTLGIGLLKTCLVRNRLIFSFL